MAAGGPLFSLYPLFWIVSAGVGYGVGGSSLTMLKGTGYKLAALEEDFLNALRCQAFLTSFEMDYCS